MALALSNSAILFPPLALPFSIHHFIIFTSDGVSGGLPSLGMKSLFPGSRVMRLYNSLSFSLPAVIAAPLLPPLDSVCHDATDKSPFNFPACWHCLHLFLIMGNTTSSNNRALSTLVGLSRTFLVSVSHVR